MFEKEQVNNNDKYEKIFAFITKLYIEAKQIEEKRRANGEFFNIFNILGVEYEEVRLHSAFIAELLNPQGGHGASYHFLQAFLNTLGIKEDYIDYTQCSLYIKERTIGPVTETEGGRIDIIVEDGRHAIIIENKIYAQDQPNQLLRYYNYGKQNFPEGFKLFYLTLDGHDPEEKSLGGKSFDYQNISYEEEIIRWLERCSEMSKDKPLANAVIKQYSEIVKQITNLDVDMQYNNNLKSVLLKQENVLAVGEIMKLQAEWEEGIIEEYIWKPLADHFQSKGFVFKKDCLYGESGAWIYREEWKYYALFVWTSNKKYWKDMHIGISSYEEPNRKYKIYKKDHVKLNCLEETPSDIWPYGWEYLPEEMRNWDCYITEEIVQGKVFEYIKEKFETILSEIEERHLKMY